MSDPLPIVLQKLTLEYVTETTPADIACDRCGEHKIEIDKDGGMSCAVMSLECTGCGVVYMPCEKCSIVDDEKCVYTHVVLCQFLGYEYLNDEFIKQQAETENKKWNEEYKRREADPEYNAKWNADQDATRAAWWDANAEDEDYPRDHIYRAWVEDGNEGFPPREPTAERSYLFDQHDVANIPANWESRNVRCIHSHNDTECGLTGPDGGYAHYWRCNHCYRLTSHNDK